MLKFMELNGKLYFGEVTENGFECVETRNGERMEDTFAQYLKAQNLGEMLTLDSENCPVVVRQLNDMQKAKFKYIEDLFTSAKRCAIKHLENDTFDRILGK